MNYITRYFVRTLKQLPTSLRLKIRMLINQIFKDKHLPDNLDADFRVRFVDLPEIIDSWVGKDIHLPSAKILDFGCGEGITALGMVLRKQVPRLMGVDIMPDVEQCLSRSKQNLGIETLPGNLKLQRIAPGADFATGETFDLIYSWSVFEHVEQTLMPKVLRQLHNKLSKKGYFFVQIAPLYYSFEGSHLFHRIPEPWGHLLNQQSIYYAKLCQACHSKEEVDALWSCYQWLNQITASQLKLEIERAGFRVKREYVTQSQHKPPKQLQEIFNEEVLRTHQVVYLCQPAT